MFKRRERQKTKNFFFRIFIYKLVITVNPTANKKISTDVPLYENVDHQEMEASY